MNTQLFKLELTRVVKMAIARLDRGTVGIGDDCLWQLVVGPLQRECPNAPMGTNCGWAARQVFDEIVTAAPFNRFVYRQKMNQGTVWADEQGVAK